MATIKEITAMCKAGQVAEAYELAKADYEAAKRCDYHIKAKKLKVKLEN